MVHVRLRNLSAAEFLIVGLGILGYKNKRCNATEIRRFRAHFGATCSSDSTTNLLCIVASLHRRLSFASLDHHHGTPWRRTIGYWDC
jgi:hypothetical protein